MSRYIYITVVPHNSFQMASIKSLLSLLNANTVSILWVSPFWGSRFSILSRELQFLLAQGFPLLFSSRSLYQTEFLLHNSGPSEMKLGITWSCSRLQVLPLEVRVISTDRQLPNCYMFRKDSNRLFFQIFISAKKSKTGEAPYSSMKPVISNMKKVSECWALFRLSLKIVRREAVFWKIFRFFSGRLRARYPRIL